MLGFVRVFEVLTGPGNPFRIGRRGSCYGVVLDQLIFLVEFCNHGPNAFANAFPAAFLSWGSAGPPLSAVMPIVTSRAPAVSSEDSDLVSSAFTF